MWKILTDNQMSKKNKHTYQQPKLSPKCDKLSLRKIPIIFPKWAKKLLDESYSMKLINTFPESSKTCSEAKIVNS
jgi:hypothetical protein